MGAELLLSPLLFVQLLSKLIELFASAGLSRVNALSLLFALHSAAHLSIVLVLLSWLLSWLAALLFRENAGGEDALTDVLSIVLHSIVEILAEHDRLLRHHLPVIVSKHWVEKMIALRLLTDLLRATEGVESIV